MVQIDYVITIFYKAIFPKNLLQGHFPWGDPLVVSSPLTKIVGRKLPPHSPVRKWDPSMA
jgi:hypothetical protein